MPDYTTASRTKDHFQVLLFQEHPEIVSIAPRLKLDDQGRLTSEAVIVVGVRKFNPIRLGPGASSGPRSTPIPDRLPAITTQGEEDRLQFVEVIVEEEGEIVLQSFTAKRRPCPGGYSVAHPRFTAGTLGGVARVGSDWGYILSNNHVLASSNSGAVGDPIYQPGVYDGGGPADTIGLLHRWVPVDVSGGNNEVDCAFARVLEPPDQNATRHVEGIGMPGAVADARVGQPVRKAGRTTEVTTGTIVSDNATLRLVYAGGQAIFVNQLQYSYMAREGDSGALVWDQSSLTVVGLHFAGSNIASYGNKIRRVLELLGQARTVFDAQGRPTAFPTIDVSLTDQP
jgi:hypothetical protein